MAQQFSEADLIAVAQKVNQCVDSMTPERWLKEGVVIENGQLIETNLYYKTCIRGETDQAKIDRCWEGSTFATRNKKYVEIYCKAKVREENPSGPNPFEVPLEKDPELQKKREAAKALDNNIEKSKQKIEKRNEFLKNKKDAALSAAKSAAKAAAAKAVSDAIAKAAGNNLVGQVAAAAGQAAAAAAAVAAAVKLAQSLKPRKKIEDKKIQEKQEVAVEEKKVKEERTKVTKQNVQKSVETYSYPLTPKPTPTPKELPQPTPVPPTPTIISSTPTLTPTPEPTAPPGTYKVELVLQAPDQNNKVKYGYTFFKKATNERVAGYISVPFVYSVETAASQKQRLIPIILKKVRESGFGFAGDKQPDFSENDIIEVQRTTESA